MPFAVYSAIRLVLLVAAIVALWFAGANLPLAIALGVVIAFAVAYLGFRRQRDAAATWLAARSERRTAARAAGEVKPDPDAEFEDAAIDAGPETSNQNEE